MSMVRLDQVIRMQELGLPVKKQETAFWQEMLKELWLQWVSYDSTSDDKWHYIMVHVQDMT